MPSYIWGSFNESFIFLHFSWFRRLVGIEIINCLCLAKRGLRVARYVRPYLRDIYQRRLIQGPEKFRPRSAWKPWNYDAEIVAFGNRIQENISPQILRACFLDQSHVSYINQGDLTESSRLVEDNRPLAELGTF